MGTLLDRISTRCWVHILQRQERGLLEGAIVLSVSIILSNTMDSLCSLSTFETLNFFNSAIAVSKKE